MSRPVVLLDCDGVLSDFVGAYLEAVRFCAGLTQRIPHEAVNQWQIERCSFFVDLLKEHPKLRSDVNKMVAQEGFCERLEPIPGAIEGVESLRVIADVYVVTSPWDSSQTWMHERARWLREHAGFDMKHIVHTHSKHLVVGDFLVDDRAANLATWNHGERVLWAQPWNQGEHGSVDGPSVRTSDWGLLRDLVESYGDCV